MNVEYQLLKQNLLEFNILPLWSQGAISRITFHFWRLQFYGDNTLLSSTLFDCCVVHAPTTAYKPRIRHFIDFYDFIYVFMVQSDCILLYFYVLNTLSEMKK